MEINLNYIVCPHCGEPHDPLQQSEIKGKTKCKICGRIFSYCIEKILAYVAYVADEDIIMEIK